MKVNDAIGKAAAIIRKLKFFMEDFFEGIP